MMEENEPSHQETDSWSSVCVCVCVCVCGHLVISSRELC